MFFLLCTHIYVYKTCLASSRINQIVKNRTTFTEAKMSCRQSVCHQIVSHPEGWIFTIFTDDMSVAVIPTNTKNKDCI